MSNLVQAVIGLLTIPYVSIGLLVAILLGILKSKL